MQKLETTAKKWQNSRIFSTNARRRCSPYSMSVRWLTQQHQAAVQAQAPRASTKASASELKPERLTHDASASASRSWTKCFRAYFDTAQMGSLPCSQQQAYLCNYIDTVLRARIDREASNTTPVYSPIVGLYACIAICLLYTSPSPRDRQKSRMPSSA